MRSGADVRAVPAEGLPTYPEPYPRFFEGAEPGPRVVGSVQVQDVKGMWALVSVDGEERGWVDGRRLEPPVAAPVIVSGPPAGTMPAPTPRRAGSVLDFDRRHHRRARGDRDHRRRDARLDARSRTPSTSFKVPVKFLFDYKTTARDPHLGGFLIAIGVLALVASLFVRAGIWRVLLGILALVAASLFCIQIRRGLSDSNSSASFTDIVGPGPWVTGISGFVLMLSPLFTQRN